MNNIYGDFTWWQGVVEDRNDPLKLGRCRVRVVGYHTDNKSSNGIPTSSLPWATPMQPITSAAMSGVGTTPMGPVEGTWVFGFWRDGKNAQEPVIIGTVGGKPEVGPDPSRGFNDPKGKYPLSDYLARKEPDTNRLARGIGHTSESSNNWISDGYAKFNGENAQSLRHKRKTRVRGNPLTGSDVTNTGIPMGVAGNLWDDESARGTIKNTADGNVKVSDSYEGDANHYKNDYWNEPNPRYGGTADSDTVYHSSVTQSSQYPYNHVRMSESGHVEEWDDTKDAQRLHRYHCKGTFEEIQPDGTRVVKVVGDDYEIIAGSQNVYVKGVCNLTINGDCRVLYRGDLVQEVVGDYHLHVGGEMRTKIFGNDAKEVMSNRKITVNGEDDLFVAKNQIINIGDNKTITVGGNLKDTVKKDVDSLYGYNTGIVPGHHTINVAGLANYNVDSEYTIFCKDHIRVTTLTKLDMIVTTDYHQDVGGNSLIEVTGTGTETIDGAVTETYGATQGTTATGNITIIAPEIQLNP